MTVPLALDIERLTIDERIELAQALWNSIEPEQDDAVGLSSDQIDEIDRRWAKYLTNPGDGATWDEVEARIVGTR
jgi:putative addiction module component (TIGR02574 family)